MARAPTLILGAMPSEVGVLVGALREPRSGVLDGFPYDAGRLAGRRVVIAVTGVGVSNGAMIAALFIHHFRPREVIVSGTGSRLTARVRTGDTVISTKTIHHAAGSLTAHGMLYRKVRGPRRDEMTSWYYRPDPTLLALAKASIATYEPRAIVVAGERYLPRVFPGVVCASDLFGVSDEKIADIKAKLRADIMEMESAAIAQVAHHLRVPHVVFRAGSNRTQANPGNDYRKLGQIAARAAARWTAHFVGALAAAS